jgi:hypothetical protein
VYLPGISPRWVKTLDVIDSVMGILRVGPIGGPVGVDDILKKDEKLQHPTSNFEKGMLSINKLT